MFASDSASGSCVSEVSKLVLTFFMMSEARWTAAFMPVKRAAWFSVYNWQVASDVVLPNVFTEKRESV